MGRLLLLLVAIAVARAQNTCDLTELLPLASELDTSCRSIIRADLGEVGGEILINYQLIIIRMSCVAGSRRTSRSSRRRAASAQLVSPPPSPCQSPLTQARPTVCVRLVDNLFDHFSLLSNEYAHLFAGCMRVLLCNEANRRLAASSAAACCSLRTPQTASSTS